MQGGNVGFTGCAIVGIRFVCFVDESPAATVSFHVTEQLLSSLRRRSDGVDAGGYAGALSQDFCAACAFLVGIAAASIQRVDQIYDLVQHVQLPLLGSSLVGDQLGSFLYGSGCLLVRLFGGFQRGLGRKG